MLNDLWKCAVLHLVSAFVVLSSGSGWWTLILEKALHCYAPLRSPPATWISSIPVWGFLPVSEINIFRGQNPTRKCNNYLSLWQLYNNTLAVPKSFEISRIRTKWAVSTAPRSAQRRNGQSCPLRPTWTPLGALLKPPRVTISGKENYMKVVLYLMTTFWAKSPRAIVLETLARFDESNWVENLQRVC